MVVLYTGEKASGYKVISSYKVCAVCKESKNRLEFGFREKSGFWDSMCRKCNAEDCKNRYHTNPEHRRRSLESAATWNANNPDRRNATLKRYVDNNKDKVRASKKAWQVANKDVSNTYTNKRRAKIRGNEGSYTAQEWVDVKAAYDHTCLRCGKQEPEIKLTVDHVLPVSMGGPNSIGNLQPLCGPCNSSKRDQHIDYRPTWAREKSYAFADNELWLHEARLGANKLGRADERDHRWN